MGWTNLSSSEFQNLGLFPLLLCSWPQETKWLLWFSGWFLCWGQNDAITTICFCGTIICTNAFLMIHRQVQLVGTRMYALNGFLVMYSPEIRLKLSSSFSRCHQCNCQTGTTSSACFPEPELNWRFASKNLWLQPPVAIFWHSAWPKVPRIYSLEIRSP